MTATDRDRELARESVSAINRREQEGMQDGSFGPSSTEMVEIVAAALAKAREDGRQEATKPMVPSDGSVWHWEATTPHASVIIRVVSSKWNGEEWWIQSSDANGNTTWNDLGRFLEASVLLEAGE